MPSGNIKPLAISSGNISETNVNAIGNPFEITNTQMTAHNKLTSLFLFKFDITIFFIFILTIPEIILRLCKR